MGINHKSMTGRTLFLSSSVCQSLSCSFIWCDLIIAISDRDFVGFCSSKQPTIQTENGITDLERLDYIHCHPNEPHYANLHHIHVQRKMLLSINTCLPETNFPTAFSGALYSMMPSIYISRVVSTGNCIHATTCSQVPHTDCLSGLTTPKSFCELKLKKSY